MYFMFLLLFGNTVVRRSIVMSAIHIKCRSKVYPRSDVKRFPVPDDKVDWSTQYEEYNPPIYTASVILGKPWADPDIGDPNFKPKWNKIDGCISRESYTRHYDIVHGVPLNPIGRTGIKGRGVLGRWGPNHAADPIVTRWKEHDSNEGIGRHKKYILQFVAIKRGDTGEWALPGGMVEPGEKVTTAAVREFQEEATNSLNMTDDELSSWKERFKTFFNTGDQVYKGYVDDPRNTDNAWMETIAFNFHDDDGSIVGALNLQAGDDAVNAKWVDFSPDLKLYASHKIMVETVWKKLIPET